MGQVSWGEIVLRTLKQFVAVCLWTGLAGVSLSAHSGPPYPIVSHRVVGSYDISIWTDPDTTDDGTAAGKFWVMLKPLHANPAIAPGTGAEVSATPSDRSGETRRGATAPVNDDVTNQFAAIVLDHEGPFAVHVAVDGPMGRADLDAAVDATYDLRPARWLLALYLMPFLLAGLLWGKLLLRRSASARAPGAGPQPSVRATSRAR